MFYLLIKELMCTFINTKIYSFTNNIDNDSKFNVKSTEEYPTDKKKEH